MRPPPAVPPIRQRVTQRPTYRNHNIDRFDLWYRDNEPALLQYEDQLSRSDDGAQVDQQEFLAREFVRLKHVVADDPL